MAKNEIVTVDENQLATGMEPWKVKILAIGGVLGLAAGLVSAFLLVKNSEKTGKHPEISAREGFQLAVLLFGTIRSVASMWEE